MTTIYREAVEMSSLTVQKELELPAGSLTDLHFDDAAATRLDAEKYEHRVSVVWSTATPATTVATEEEMIYEAKADGTIEKVTVHPETVPTGDFQYTVQIKKAADGASSPVSILSSAITISAADTDYTKETPGTIGTSTFSRGDRFSVEITASGSSGTQGAGATVRLTLHEHAEA